MAGVLKRGLAALVLSLALVLGLVGCRQGANTRPDPAAGRSGPGLQEVAPPAAVLQLKAALDRHQPRLAITAPDDDSLLPAGPWQLEIDVRDWPLVDAGPLGLGPHLVVQIDNQAPIRTTAATPTSATDAASRTVRLRLDPLSPGTHRITAYAARPWGESVKDPAASSQITVHRVAPTPHQPRGHEPQLLAVSPPTLSGSEPVLIDWLLRNAPLQHLRDDDTRWRLRITVNGDSFQVDRQIPLWLRGFRPGSNAVTLELLDGLGEPIAPGLNTVVQEVILQPGERPVWNGSALAPDVLAALLGEGPPPAAASETIATRPPPKDTAAVADKPATVAIDSAESAAAAPPLTADDDRAKNRAGTQPETEGTGAPPTGAPETAEPETAEQDSEAQDAEATTIAIPAVTGSGSTTTTLPTTSEPPPPEAMPPVTADPVARVIEAASQPPATPTEHSPPAATPPVDGDELPVTTDSATDQPKVQESTPQQPMPPTTPPSDPTAARRERPADGSVIRPQPQGFLSGLQRARS